MIDVQERGGPSQQNKIEKLITSKNKIHVLSSSESKHGKKRPKPKLLFIQNFVTSQQHMVLSMYSCEMKTDGREY